MTNSSDQRQRSKLLVAASALCVLTLTASACGSTASETTGASDTNVASETNDAADGAGSSAHPSSGRAGELQYGDSFVDFNRASAGSADTANPTMPGFRSVEWEDLIPPGFSGEEILERYRERLDAAAPGSPELDAIYDEMIAEYDDTSINADLDSEEIQLAGFVAPLTYEGDRIVEFLLVPYFGACIHVPPPPANQTVMITLADGESLSLEESWGAVWVAGEMAATTTTTDLATAGYSITEAAFGVYES